MESSSLCGLIAPANTGSVSNDTHLRSEPAGDLITLLVIVSTSPTAVSIRGKKLHSRRISMARWLPPLEGHLTGHTSTPVPLSSSTRLKRRMAQ